VLLRAGRRLGRHRDVRNGASDCVDGGSFAEDYRPRRRARWWLSLARAAVVTVLGVGVVVTLSPGNGASGVATGLVRAVQHLTSTSRNAQAFSGTPAVGALFTTSAGRLSQHYCTASVIDSPGGDLAITAAHCVTGTSGTVDFVPGYNKGATPYGVWTVTKVYVDQAWTSSSDPDDDFAIVRVSQPGSSVPVEDVTGAETLVTGTTPGHRLVQVVGYPNTSSQPISCQNWLREPMVDQLEFDCGDYTNGTSGGPFLTEVDQASGQGMLIGVIGGYEQGGVLPQISYSSVLGASAAALYHTAVADG
jgi:V8-like Glu-specific endopeptidase